MVKKGTKRKTRWRTLSIGDGGTDNSDTGITETKQEQNECLTTTSNTNLSTYSRKSSSHTTPFHQRNGDRNHYYRNSDKYPSQPHTRTQSHEENLHQHTPFAYKRRPFYQTSSSRYYGNNNKPNPSSNNRSYRSADTFDNKENATTKPLFNEDDYTRITTPRQDVLFKKGYLSRPKKTITPIDTTVSSSTTVSVVSMEDSISSGTQSLSPEHCSSTPEIFDPDHPLMYPGFYDQNGVFFVNPFIPNGFDPYDGQMIMMPYGGSPFSINPTEYCSSESTPPYPPNHYQKRNSVDSENSPESPCSQNESASASSTPAIDESSNEPSQNGDAPTESQSESDGPKPEDEVTANDCNHNMPMQFYYPFMYGPPPFMPINEMEYNDGMPQYVNGYGVKYNRFRKRKRRPFKWGNSTGVSATTTDYSEDEDSIEENNRILDQALQPNGIESKPCLTMAQCDDVISRTTLNTNVSEFVPRYLQTSPSRTTLNVEVEEFHPRNYKSTVQSKSSDDDPDSSSKETVVKQTTPEPQKVTILHRTPTEKYSQTTPIKTGKGKPEHMSVQVSSAINKSSTLISSISSRDKNDDNVNGVDKNKKIEKLVDPVNVKADLDDKVVMHPKQQENILENVKKTKFKNMKNGKSSPRKMNNGLKKDVKIGKGAITNGKCENIHVVAKEQLERTESKQSEVVNPSGVGEGNEKQNQPTYAQMVGPVSKPKIKIVKTVATNPSQEIVEQIPAEELKVFEVIDDVKPVIKVETKWQTVRPKGKKKLLSVMCEEPNDDWNDFDEEKSDEVKEITQPISQEIQVEEPIETTDADGSTESTLATSATKDKLSKTEKVKLKLKAKKSQKKIKEKAIKANGETHDIIAEPNGASTPKKDKMTSDPMTPIIDDLFENEGHEFLKDIDISNFNFETSPSMFVNAITNSGIYTDNSMTGKSKSGFALNNSLKLLNTFDFCKTKESDLLKEEEEMVIRVMKSLSHTENPIVKDDVTRCIKIIEDVKEVCEDVKIQKSIFEDINGLDDTNNGAHTNGAEIVVKCKMNGKSDGMNEEINEKENEFLSTNGHQIEDLKIEDLNIPVIEEAILQPDKIEDTEQIQISNGNHIINELNLNFNENEIDVSAQLETCNTQLIDDKNDLDDTNVADKIETDEIEETTDENIIDVQDKDCTSNSKYDDEAPSDLSELSDDNDETIIVSQSNDYFEYDEIETIKDIKENNDDDDNVEGKIWADVDVTEMIDDLQFDDDIDDLVLGNDEEIIPAEARFCVDEVLHQNECQPQDKMMPLMQEISLEDEHTPPESNDIFIESQEDVSNTEITLNDIKENKEHDRIQSPRSSEDSGILEYQDDGRYFSESDNDNKPEQLSITNFPLTEAVSRWLEEKQKEKSPEPILRLPEDPQLSQRIEKSIKDRLHISQFFDDYDDEDTSDESETEFEATNFSKNLLSNPLRVLFPKQKTATANQMNQSNDVEVNANGIRKRVANHNLEADKSSVTVDEPDIVEFWENDPMLQSQHINSNVLKIDQNSSVESELEAYESVYGKTIDYIKLSANIHNDDVFLSNNILNNDNLSAVPNNPINNNNDTSLLQASSINRKDDINSSNRNLNCFKPPEICCMLM